MSTGIEAERFNEEARRLTPANTGRVLFSTLHAADIAAGRGQNDDAASSCIQRDPDGTRRRGGPSMGRARRSGD